MNLNIELYKENGVFCAWISDDCGGSGIKVEGGSPEEVADKMQSYVVEYFSQI